MVKNEGQRKINFLLISHQATYVPENTELTDHKRVNKIVCITDNKRTCSIHDIT